MSQDRPLRNDSIDKDTDVESGDRANIDAPVLKFEAPELVRDLSPEERHELEAKLKRKIDLRLMPMVILMYIMNYLDRNNIAAVRFAGLQEELNLSAVQYQTTVSILFVGYILMQGE